MDLEWRTANSNGNQLLNQEIYLYIYACVGVFVCVCRRAHMFVCVHMRVWTRASLLKITLTRI